MHRRKILVIQDEFLLADDCALGVQRLGFEVAGPFDAIEAIPFDLRSIAGAIVDINVRGRSTYPLLDELLAWDIPVTLYTGYERRLIPRKYDHCGYVQKPRGCEDAIHDLCNQLNSRFNPGTLPIP